jgi:hypothetical protein
LEGVLVGFGGTSINSLDDYLAVLYGCTSDSGVQVVRFKALSGKAVWQTRCAPLGVGHRKYRHMATMVFNGDRLEICSSGGAGAFVEVLALDSGKRLQRTVLLN